MTRFLICLLFSNSFVFAQDLIWVEGEKAASSSAKRHGWYDSVKKDQLSGDNWLCHFSKAGPALAKYNIQAKTGEYEFWVRANPTGGAKLSWRLGGQSRWNEIALKESMEQANIAADGKIDLRYVAWCKVGKIKLPGGKTTLEFQMHSKNQNHGGLDCFVLSSLPFTPSGKLKPGEKLGLADPGMWAFEPGPDPLSPEAKLDLSKMNEDTAGMHGFIRHDSQGDFVRGDGKTIRFWAVNTGFHYKTSDMDSLSYHAKWLARRGVNMVRSHSHLLSKAQNAKVTDASQQELERIWRLVAAMKKEGIYTTISPYWAVAVKWRASLGIANPEGSNLTGMLFWDEKLQAGYRSWWKALLTQKNPHTGIPLAQDPAVAILQLQNEDSLLFYTLQSVQGEARRDLRKKFHAFLTKKHRSMDAAEKSWGGAVKHKNDNPTAGEMGLFSVWHLTQNAKSAKHHRYADQLEFYGRLMYDFNKKMADYLRNELGCKHLINAGNWHTADAAKMYDIERWSYTANEVIGTNRYFNGGSHVNPTEKRKSGYLVSKGDLFSGKSVLRQPRRFPLAVKQPAGKPFIISESSWVPPLKYQSEGPFLVAAYSSLTGFDAFYWFSMGDSDFGRPMGKWQMNTPMLLGQFPAAALLFRSGYLKRGEPVLEEHRSLDELWQRRKPLAVEDAGYDPNRDTGTFNQLSSVKASMDPLAYLAGPVQVYYNSDPTKSQLVPVNTAGGVVTSQTGELKWDSKNGVCILNSPKAQGVTGFIQGKRIETSAFSFLSQNEYITALAISGDGKSLSETKKVFMQIGTVSRPYGWKTRRKGESQEIVSLGSTPWNIEITKLSVALKNPHLKRAEVLDANFLKTGEIAINGKKFEAPADAMYLLLVE